MDLVDRFMDLFRGYENARGQYTPRGVSSSGKVEGRAVTQREGATREHYEAHLKGKPEQLGLIPLMENHSVWFGAIDIDVKGIDLKKLEEDVGDLPLLVCRSKSGGAHLYLFAAEPLPAGLVVERLSEWAAALGHGGCEIFPKQTSRVSSADLGNWINIPYEGGLLKTFKTHRLAFKGGQLIESLETFLELAEAIRVTELDLRSIEIEVESDQFADGPPCLQRLVQQGFGEGSRKDGLFSVGVYYKKKDDVSWENLLAEFNFKHMDPPLSNSDVQDVIRSLKRKEYVYKCKQPPLKPFCNKRKCMGQPYGIGVGGVGSSTPIVFGTLTKYQTEFGDAYWVVEVNGTRLEITDAQDFLSQSRFAKIAFERLNMALPTMPGPRWTSMLQNILQSVEIIEIPPEASEEGQFRELTNLFLEMMATGRSRDGLMIGQGCTEDGITWFRSIDLFAFLDSKRAKVDSKKKAWAYLSRMGAKKKGFNVKGAYINAWGLPAVRKEDLAPLDVPDFHGEEAF